MQLIETIEVGAGGAASIEFTGIPQDGVDLLVLASVRNDIASGLAWGGVVEINSTGGSYIELQGTGTSTSSGSGAFIPLRMTTDTATANTFNSVALRVANYTSAAAKSISSDQVFENNATEARQYLIAATTTSTSAVTSISLNAAGTANFVQYSTASLYKITAD